MSPDYSREHADVDRILPGFRPKPRICETSMGGGRKCGAPATATIGEIPVCAECAEGAAPALDYIRNLMRGDS